jgi:glutathione peroxidase-family protein
LRANIEVEGAKGSDTIDGKEAGKISTNFAKFLVDGEGKVVASFKPSTNPMSFELEIKKILSL